MMPAQMVNRSWMVSTALDINMRMRSVQLFISIAPIFSIHTQPWLAIITLDSKRPQSALGYTIQGNYKFVRSSDSASDAELGMKIWPVDKPYPSTFYW